MTPLTHNRGESLGADEETSHKREYFKEVGTQGTEPLIFVVIQTTENERGVVGDRR